MSAKSWKILRASNIEAQAAMSRAMGRCVCTLAGGGRCQAPASCVVEYENRNEPTRRAACCEACRRKCFGPTDRERAAVKREAAAKQDLLFAPEIVNREEPQAWRR